MLEVSIEAALLDAESPERVRLVQRRAARTRRRWRNRELTELGQLDIGGEA